MKNRHMLATRGNDWFAKRHAAGSVACTYAAVLLSLSAYVALGGDPLGPASPFVAIPAIVIVPIFLAVPVFFLLLPASYMVDRLLRYCRLDLSSIYSCLGGIVAVVLTASVPLLLAYLLSAPLADPYQLGVLAAESDWPSDLAFHAIWIVSAAIGGYASFAARTRMEPCLE